jgi:hypothetical protein
MDRIPSSMKISQSHVAAEQKFRNELGLNYHNYDTQKLSELHSQDRV